MLGYQQTTGPIRRRSGGWNVRESLVQSGKEFSMRFMKTAMAIAAVSVAMLSLTMAVKRQRQGQGQDQGQDQGRKGRRSRA
jgi:hypothetical protein